MAKSKFEESIENFIKAGNEVIGDLPVADGTSCVVFNGTGHKLIFGSNVRLATCRIQFNGVNSVISFGASSKVRGAFIAQESGNIYIGEKNSFSSKEARFHACEKTLIQTGIDCLFAGVRIRSSDMHSIIDLDTGKRINPAADVIIGDHVWLAEAVRIFKGVQIGTGSIVGATSVVVKSLPGNSLCVGSPAKAVKSNISWNVKRI